MTNDLQEWKERVKAWRKRVKWEMTDEEKQDLLRKFHAMEEEERDRYLADIHARNEAAYQEIMETLEKLKHIS